MADRLKGVKHALQELDQHELEKVSKRKKKLAGLKKVALNNAPAARASRVPGAMNHAEAVLAERALLLELLKESFPQRSEEDLLEELLAFGA